MYEVHAGKRVEVINALDNEKNYEIDIHNVSLSRNYTDYNGKEIIMRDGDILYLKYNANLEKSIGITVDEMVLQRKPYYESYLAGEEPVPFAEVSLLGINTENDYWRYIYQAWDCPGFRY